MINYIVFFQTARSGENVEKLYNRKCEIENEIKEAQENQVNILIKFIGI